MFDFLKVGQNIDTLGLNAPLNWLRTAIPLTAAYPLIIKRAHMFHRHATVLVSSSGTGIMTGLSPASCLDPHHDMWVLNNSIGAGDLWENKFFLSAGTYTLHVMAQKTTYSGIMQWSVNGNVLGSVDYYAAASALYIHSFAGVVIAAPGKHSLQGLTTGKNASSTDYYNYFSTYWLTPASD